MNRRNFLGRIGVVAAVPALVKITGDAEPLRQTAFENPPASGSILRAAPSDAPTVIAVPPAPFNRDRIALLRARGLMVPCPNCGTTNWQRDLGPYVKCALCDWRDHEDLFTRRCECGDCTLTARTAEPADLAFIETVAPAGGFYSVTRSGRDITRETRNGYDVADDRRLHNVIERRLARVACAVRVSSDESKSGASYAPRHERTYQPNGNIVVHGWEIIDCYEWQQERGERPALVLEVNGRGFAWKRHA